MIFNLHLGKSNRDRITFRMSTLSLRIGNKNMKLIRLLLAILICSTLYHTSYSQIGAEIEVEKPKKYENRKLRAEKTGEKKLSAPKRLYQNTVTHYNYYFNANLRLNELVNTASQGAKDDYTKLLPFYNYTLEATSQNKVELDSIVYKCTAGILLHDLRNDWIDNMFLLLAKAYFYRNDLDSANLTLQYINFSFAPKEAGGYDKPIGSSSSNDKGIFTISTKEKKSIFNKVFARPPSRNESFIWQIRTYIERNELGEAAGIIEILKNDPNFPKRLGTDLHEVTSYWFYKQKLYDSAAHHLSLALDNAKGTQEKARWEYLIAQMYQLAKNKELSGKYYQRAMDHTIDPIMDVYARLNALKLQNSGNKNFMQDNIDALHSMAKKDKYEAYRDIIYYAAATIELDRKNFANAQKDLLKSVEFTTSNPAQRSQAFLLLADLNYEQKEFTSAYNFYDSLDVNVLTDSADKDIVNFRKPILKIIVTNKLSIKEQDSLQALAKMTPEQREAFIKKHQKKSGKDIKETKEDFRGSSNPAVKQPVTDLFSNNDKDKGNEFYFYNSSVKSKGFNEFKSRWGARPNVDNWRRQAAINKMSTRLSDVDDVNVDNEEQQTKEVDTVSISMSNTIPVTPEELAKSNKLIMDGLYENGNLFMNKLENYHAAIETYEELLTRFPETGYKDEVLFNLVYACQKTRDKAKEEKYKNQLLASTSDSKWQKFMKNPALGKVDKTPSAATKKYEEIYNLFIEGKFEEAKNEKRIADSLYDKSNWTPQLLFIEAIYYIKMQDDSTAIKVLTNLSTGFDGTPMAERAKTMIDVLKRRKEIETYLTNLEIKKAEDGSVTVKETSPNPIVAVRKQNEQKQDVATEKKPEEKKEDKPEDKPEEKPEDKNEDSNSDTAAVQEDPPAMLDTANTVIPEKGDTTIDAPLISVKDFTFIPDDQHYAVILLDKVDPVYAGEAKNAFNRYNKEKFYGQQINITSEKLDDRYNLVLQGPFPDADAAIEYINKIRPFAPSRILPWLSATKYSYLIINDDNLETLKQNKDIDAYKQLMLLALPGKF